MNQDLYELLIRIEGANEAELRDIARTLVKRVNRAEARAARYNTIVASIAAGLRERGDLT